MVKIQAALCGILVLALVAGPAAATVTVRSIVEGPSVPVLFNAVKVPVNVGPGDTVSATLRYIPSETTDLDLVLHSPFYEALPLVSTVQSGNAAAIQRIGEHYAAQRVGRTTCDDTAAFSQGHLGQDNGRETITATLEAGDEAGRYALLVTGFLLLDATTFTLDVTVTDASGADVSEARVEPREDTSVSNAWAYCDAGARQALHG